MNCRDGQPKRRDGVDGWFKGPCPYAAPHGWAWWKEGRGCTCSPCTPHKEYRDQVDMFDLVGPWP